MRVIAPGKLLLAGAYAVLEGAPALVVGVDRHAVADGERTAAHPTPEVLAALAREEAPEIDASALRSDGFKLGLGSSAAILVASLGVAAVRRGDDLKLAAVRDALFLAARKAHAAVQQGGSGVDVAASVYGGALAFSLSGTGAAQVLPASLPRALVVEVFWCGAPAITTGMRARVDALKARDRRAYGTHIEALGAAAASALAAGRADHVGAFVESTRATGVALAALGRDADAPIFPPATAPLVALADTDGAAFIPSGAGGGDVFVHVGAAPSSPPFRAAATSAGLRLLSMHLDLEGVRTQ